MTAPDRIWTAPTDGKCHVGFDTKSMNYTIEYARVTPDTIPLPRAEVERLYDAMIAAMLHVGEDQWSEPWFFNATLAITVMKERMK